MVRKPSSLINFIAARFLVGFQWLMATVVGCCSPIRGKVQLKGMDMGINPPSKAVKGLADGTLRTTMTHLIVGDVILVMTATSDPGDFVKAAPSPAPKRAFWATVATVATAGLVVVAEDGDRIIITDCAPQAAVTIRDREVAPVGPTVVIQGSHVHAEGVPCGRVYDDEKISGVDTDASADCPGCLSQPQELTAGDGSTIRVGSPVFAAFPGSGTLTAGRVVSLAEYHDGEWVGLVNVRSEGDKKLYGFGASSLTTTSQAVSAGTGDVATVDELAMARSMFGKRVRFDDGDGDYAAGGGSYGVVTSFHAGLHGIQLMAVAVGNRTVTVRPTSATLVGDAVTADAGALSVDGEKSSRKGWVPGCRVCRLPVMPGGVDHSACQRGVEKINDADVALLSGDPVPITVMVPVTIEDSRPVYRVVGHGDRAYHLVSVDRDVATLRPVEGGVLWSHVTCDVYRVGSLVSLAAPRWKARDGYRKCTGVTRRQRQVAAR